MKPLNAWLLLAAMLLPTLVSAQDKVATTPQIKVQVQVDAQGHLGQITPMQKLDEPYASLVQRTLAAWSFYPAQVQGKPVVTTTWLTIELKAQPRGNGDFDVQVVYLGNGPYFELAPPKYPAVICDAKIVVEATIGTDGGFSDVQIVQTKTSNGMPAKDFVRSVLDSMKLTKVRPIIVDGEPVVSHISFPIIYSQVGTPHRTLWPASDSARFASKKLILAERTEKAELPEGVMVAFDSPVSPRSTPGG